MSGLKMEVELEYLNLLITKECNLQCLICDYRSSRLGQEELTLDQIRGIIREAAGLGVKRLDITGGEPMLRPDVYEIITAAKASGISANLITNGTLIGEAEAERLVQAGLDTVVISLDGFAPTHDWVRGRGNFQKTLEAIRCFLKRKARMNSINIGFTIIRRNFREMFDFTRFMLEEIGVQGITYNPFLLQIKEYSELDSLLIPREELPELELELEKIITYARTSYSGSIYQHDEFLRKIPDYFAGVRMVPTKPCIQPLHSCGIDPDGTVYPCWIEYIAAGNLKQSSLQTIITSTKYQNFCRMAALNTCKGCLSSCYNVHAPPRTAETEG